jgi:hypothetical protein
MRLSTFGDAVRGHRVIENVLQGRSGAPTRIAPNFLSLLLGIGYKVSSPAAEKILVVQIEKKDARKTAKAKILMMGLAVSLFFDSYTDPAFSHRVKLFGHASDMAFFLS